MYIGPVIKPSKTEVKYVTVHEAIANKHAVEVVKLVADGWEIISTAATSNLVHYVLTREVEV